jgi:hypothetical protein
MVGIAGIGAMARKLTALGESEISANARIRSIANSMGLFGNEADRVATRIAELSESIQMQTGVDDDQIKLAAAKLLTFKELAKTAGTVGGAFDRATQRGPVRRPGGRRCDLRRGLDPEGHCEPDREPCSYHSVNVCYLGLTPN